MLTNPHKESIVSMLQDVTPKVTSSMNEQLLYEFTRCEVARAIKQMHPSKAPGPDGFPTLFYRRYWSKVSKTIICNVLDILNVKRPVRKWNETYIALIPKIQQPKAVVDYRPIGLCNVSYKIVAKVLVNRMKWILQDIISENQYAVVSGHSIFYNIIIGHECLHSTKNRRKGRQGWVAMKHSIKNRRKGKQGWVAMKLDMSKAYDRVE